MKRALSKTDAYEMGFQSMRAHIARTGRSNSSPSIAQRQEWGSLFSEFRRGWDDAGRSTNAYRFTGVNAEDLACYDEV